jgi:hypothetical protein
MKNLKIEILIPFADDVDVDEEKILGAVSEALEESFDSLVEPEVDQTVTVAETLGFGGNTLLIGTDEHQEELCLS